MWGISRRPRRILVEQARCEGQGVAAREEDVADLGRAPQILQLGLVVAAAEVLGRVADDARAGAVPAVRRALRRDEHEHPVRIAVHEPWDGRVAVLREGVLHHRRERFLLAPERDDLAPDGVFGVVGIDEADEVRGDVHPELVRRGQALALLVGERQHGAQRLEVVDAVRELPAPVVPALIGDIGPDLRAVAALGPSIRVDRTRRVTRVHPRVAGVDGSLHASPERPRLGPCVRLVGGGDDTPRSRTLPTGARTQREGPQGDPQRDVRVIHIYPFVAVRFGPSGSRGPCGPWSRARAQRESAGCGALIQSIPVARDGSPEIVGASSSFPAMAILQGLGLPSLETRPFRRTNDANTVERDGRCRRSSRDVWRTRRRADARGVLPDPEPSSRSG